MQDVLCRCAAGAHVATWQGYRATAGARIAHKVVIAGGGVAALEALIALRELAQDRVDIDLVQVDQHVDEALAEWTQ